MKKLTEKQILAFEKEIAEDLNKILIKLKDVPKLQLAQDEEGNYFIPDRDDYSEPVYDDDGEEVEENFNGKFEDSNGEEVPYLQDYRSVNLSSIKSLISELLEKKKLNGEAEQMLAKYYSSKCW